MASNSIAALFPSNSIAQQALAEMPERLLLVAPDPQLDAIPWEYVYGPYGTDDPTSPDYTENFLVLECPFVRGLPPSQRIAPPCNRPIPPYHCCALKSTQRYSLSLSRLKRNGHASKNPSSRFPLRLRLERTIPPTLERVRHLVANQKGRVVHFMGHGGQDQHQGAVLCFEQDNGAPHLVTAKELCSVCGERSS